MPDAGVVVQQRDWVSAPPLVEQAQQHAVGGSGGHREVRAAVTGTVAPSGNGRPGSAARGRRAGVGQVASSAGLLVNGRMTSPTEATAPWRRRITSAISAGPSGLVGGAEPGAVVAVEVLVEHQVVVPGRVVSAAARPPEAGPPAVRPDGEDGDEPVLQVGGDRVQGQLVAGAGRVLDW